MKRERRPWTPRELCYLAVVLGGLAALLIMAANK